VDASAIGDEVENYAQADSDQQHPPLEVGPIVPPRPVVSPAAPEADLEVSMSYVHPGSSITYTIVAQNLGTDDADGAVVYDDVPAHIRDVSWIGVITGGATCELGGLGNTLHVTLTHFPSGGVVTFTIVGTLDFYGDETNTVTITPPEGVIDPDESNNIATVGYPYKVIMPLILQQ
jgi:uncharacterized repeat protein (TIGR01451 family)